jgi:hypothetical protein
MDAATIACAPSGVAWDGISWADVQRQVRRLQARIVKWTQAGKHNKVKALQWLLNYHRHVVAKETFGKIDSHVWAMLWQWAVRRHPEKGARWVKEKYFKTQGSRNWVFSSTEKQKDGSRVELALLKEADTPIRRHIKIKAGANPHDPKWEPYFEARWGKKMMNSPRGRVKLYRVWRRQDGLCPTCQEPIAPGMRAKPPRCATLAPERPRSSSTTLTCCSCQPRVSAR